MRQIFPVPADPDADVDVDPLDLYLGVTRPATAGRPWVAVGLVSSIDGATAVDGKSGALGGAADRLVFRAVRALADVILVGAGTARAETYGPVVLSDAAASARRAAGRTDEAPRLAFVTASLDLDPDGPMFSGPAPLVFTVESADPDRRRRLESVAEVVTAGSGRVDLSLALTDLASRGAEVVVCEGGPSLIGALVGDDLVDEWCLNVATTVVGGDSARAVAGSPRVDQPADLASLLHADGLLATRWIRRR